MSYDEFKKLPIEPWQNYVGAALLGILAVAVGGPSVYFVLSEKVGGVPVYLGLAVGLGCLVLAAIVYALRQSRFVRCLQVLAAIAAGVADFFSANDPVVKILVILVAACAAADGIEKIRNAGTKS
jgi:hypothetical protein